MAAGGYLFSSKHCASGHVEQKNVVSQVWLHMPYSKTRPEYGRPRPVDRWAPNDLRRSSRTQLAAIGCPDEVGEAILFHMKKGVTGVYSRHTYDKEKREWLSRLAPFLEKLAAS